ncbi:MAG TPA: thiamine-phosphate kinase [Bacteroidota bacterium]|nr:thiamine-phosphate kinase [Bacteroidota bacterium]
MITDIRENAVIASLATSFPRSPHQLNGLQESDAELIDLHNGTVLALTTDAISEEIASGLYADPWLAGWMAVMVNFSDLAAVGAEPLGILIAETLPADLPAETTVALQKGIRDACRACESYVLGGDTNAGGILHIAGTAVGILSHGRPLTRIGIRPDDLIFSTGPLGAGNAFAAAALAEVQGASAQYRPVARLRHGVAIRPNAGACMDTSDGALATLDQLARLNSVGFSLVPDWASRLARSATASAIGMGIPPWVLLAGPHGEFELIFSVSQERASAIQEALGSLSGECMLIARATATPGIAIPGLGLLSPDDLASIRNLEMPSKNTVSHYLRTILDIGCAAQSRTPK